MYFGVRTLDLRAVVTSHQPRSTLWWLIVALWTQDKGLEGTARQVSSKRGQYTHSHLHSPSHTDTHTFTHYPLTHQKHLHTVRNSLCLTFSVLPPADQWTRPNPSRGQEWSYIHTHTDTQTHNVTDCQCRQQTAISQVTGLTSCRADCIPHTA